MLDWIILIINDRFYDCYWGNLDVALL